MGHFQFSVLCLSLALGSPIALGEHRVPAWKEPLVPERIPEEVPTAMLEESLVSVSQNEAMKGRVQVITFRMPADFDDEFSLLVVKGKIQRAFLVSTSIAGKEPVLGIHRMVVPRVDGQPWP